MSQRQFSRRHFIGSILSVATVPFDASYFARASETASAFALPAGVEVVDYRLFRSDGVDRFLIEVFNSTSTAIDTPAIGVVLPHLDSDANFGWAVPMQEVLHPKSSSGLIGVAPTGIDNDDGWGDPEWWLCNDIQMEKANKLSAWDVEFDYSLRMLADNDVVADVQVTNNGRRIPTTVTVLGLVRDSDHRISGVTVPLYLNSVQPGETSELPVRFGPTVDYIANPKDMINADEGVSVDFTLQPWPSGINPGCSPVMNWNR